MFVVEVTYGTRKHQVYAEVPTRDSAAKLQATAIGLGYTDATIVPAKEFYEKQAEIRGGPRPPRRTDSVPR